MVARAAVIAGCWKDIGSLHLLGRPEHRFYGFVDSLAILIFVKRLDKLSGLIDPRQEAEPSNLRQLPSEHPAPARFPRGIITCHGAAHTEEPLDCKKVQRHLQALTLL